MTSLNEKIDIVKRRNRRECRPGAETERKSIELLGRLSDVKR